MKTAVLNLLRYQEDGTLWWCEEAYHNCRHKLAGSLSGTGYWYIEHRNKQHRRSRLVWEMHHGPIPVDKVVDHINGMRTDDRIENLQLMTRSEHMKTHKPKMRGKIAVCSECGKTKPIDAIKFNCCRYCYLNNHLGYRKSYCNIHKKNHSCRQNKIIFTQNTSSLNVFDETSDLR